jgi:hypothetical protein
MNIHAFARSGNHLPSAGRVIASDRRVIPHLRRQRKRFAFIAITGCCVACVHISLERRDCGARALSAKAWRVASRSEVGWGAGRGCLPSDLCAASCDSAPSGIEAATGHTLRPIEPIGRYRHDFVVPPSPPSRRRSLISLVTNSVSGRAEQPTRGRKRLSAQGLTPVERRRKS